MSTRKPYPSDVSDEEWSFVSPYLALVREDAPQRNHDLREVLNGLRWVVRTGSPWRYMPHDLPPWEAVYQQTRRWLSAGAFEEMVHDLRMLLRLSEERAADPTAAILDSRTLRSTPESGSRSGYDGHKHKNGSKVHVAVDTLGHLLALFVSPANEQDRAWVGELAGAVQEATGESVELAVRGSGLHRGATDRRSAGSWHEVGGGQAPGGQARLRALATPLGRGARFRMGVAIQAAGEGLREAVLHFGGIAFRGLCLPLPPSGNRYPRRESITRSKRF